MHKHTIQEQWKMALAAIKLTVQPRLITLHAEMWGNLWGVARYIRKSSPVSRDLVNSCTALCFHRRCTSEREREMYRLFNEDSSLCNHNGVCSMHSLSPEVWLCYLFYICVIIASRRKGNESCSVFRHVHCNLWMVQRYYEAVSVDALWKL